MMTTGSSRNVKIIALTGGACSGKTTFLNKLKEQQNGFCGYRLLFIPEAATVLASHGMSFCDGEKTYQRAILKMQMSMEELYRKYAEELDSNVCIISDRGALDGAAYCGQKTFDELCDEENTSRDKLVASYDGVLYLVSAAIGAPEHYSKQGNDTRRENLEEAKALERLTIECWKDHPNIDIIDNEGNKSFEDKMVEAEKALKKMLWVR